MFRAIALLFVALTSCGCGNADTGRYIVEGTVSLKGDPVSAGWVKLYDPAGSQVASAQIRADGGFTMTDIPKGDFKVTVESAAKIQGMNSPPPPGTTVIPGSVAKVTPIPLKYANPAKSSIDVHVPIKQEKLEIKLD